ncbi:BTB/POZ domain-containing protein 8-like isoform X2 [Lineus longissimus]|uniref:BTB/POZ domain-containing protein 8-like isoform X2 n=1 Tax=Lineus longissimus TaxID=88925 RepID=UPI002B4C3297
MPRPDNMKRLSMTLQEKCLQEREKLRVKIMKALKADMWRLYTHATDTNLTVKPREGQFSVHRQIIKQRMPLLLQDLTGDDSVINLPQVSLEDAKELFRLIYMTDDLSLATEMAQGYLNRTAEGSTTEPAPAVNDNNINFAQPDLVQGLSHSTLTNSSEELRDVTSPSSETPVGSLCSFPPTPVDENLPSFADVPAYLIGSVDVPYLPASGLGLDLLRLFLHSSDGDVAFKVGDEEFRGHQFLLTTRCNYFEMMLGGAWVESSAQSVKLDGVSAAAFQQALLYLYGGVIDIDTDCHVQDLLILADMYGMDGLKDVVIFEIKKNYCHFFHKPCPECITKVADALCLSFSHGMEDLLHKILRWCDKYFVKMWPTKQFASLPTEILEKCCDTVSADLTKDSVIDVIFDCDKLKGSIPQVKWAEPINKLAARLMGACIIYLQNNLFEVLESRTFSDLGRNMAWSLNFLEEVITTTVKQMPHSVSCKTFMSAFRLCQHADSEECGWNDDFKVFVRTLTEKCRQNLRNNISYLEFTPEFEKLPAAEQKTIKEGASFVNVGDSKVKRTPPKLSSDNKKFTGKKHGGIPFTLPKGVPPKTKLKMVAPPAAKWNASVSSDASTKPTTGGARSKGNAAGASGGPDQKKIALPTTRPSLPGTSDKDSKSSKANQKHAALPGPSKPRATSVAVSLNRSEIVGPSRAASAKSHANQSFDLGVKRLDQSVDKGPSAATNTKSASKMNQSSSKGPGSASASTSGAMKKTLKPPKKDSGNSASGARKSASPSSDSGVSSVSSTAEARPRPKGQTRRSLGPVPPPKKPDPCLNVTITMPVDPLAHSTPMAKPSKLRQPQVHSPTKDKCGGGLFRAPLNPGPRKSAVGSRVLNKPIGSTVGKSAAKQDMKKPPNMSVDVDSNTQKSRLPVRSPIKKTFSASTPQLSPAKSLPGSRYSRLARSYVRLNESCVPLPYRHSSASGRLSFSSRSPRRGKSASPEKPQNFCSLCRETIKGDYEDVKLPESRNVEFEVLPKEFLEVKFVKP